MIAVVGATIADQLLNRSILLGDTRESTRTSEYADAYMRKCRMRMYIRKALLHKPHRCVTLY